jgi:hypothetical protein
MSLFSEIEKTIDRGFRRWASHMFGAADSDQLLLVHRAIMEELETKIQTVARGQRIFPYSHVVVTLVSADPDRRAVYQTAFGEEGRLEKEVREALTASACQIPRNFSLEVKVSETGERAFEIEYSSEPVERIVKPAAPGRLTVIQGKSQEPEYVLDKPRTNLGRLAELTDAEHRIIRRNDVVFDEGADEANATVSRKHAHIRLDDGDYRICDDGSEFGTRVFREGRTIEVPSGNRRGEKLRPGDEIYLGRARMRFER